MVAIHIPTGPDQQRMTEFGTATPLVTGAAAQEASISTATSRTQQTGASPHSAYAVDVLRLVLPPMSNNCYLLCCGGHAIVVDAPSNPALIEDVLRALGLTVDALVTTHSHHDHVGGLLAFLKQHPGLAHIAAAGDAPDLPGAVTATAHHGDELVWHVPAGTVVKDTRDARDARDAGDTGDTAARGDAREGMTVRLPLITLRGHTVEGLCVLLPAGVTAWWCEAPLLVVPNEQGGLGVNSQVSSENLHINPAELQAAAATGLPVAGPVLITGASLFPGGVGKTHSPAAFTQLLGDVTDRVFDVLPDCTVVLPGHGDATTLGAERPALPEWRARGW